MTLFTLYTLCLPWIFNHISHSFPLYYACISYMHRYIYQFIIIRIKSIDVHIKVIKILFRKKNQVLRMNFSIICRLCGVRTSTSYTFIQWLLFFSLRSYLIFACLSLYLRSIVLCPLLAITFDWQFNIVQ